MEKFVRIVTTVMMVSLIFILLYSMFEPQLDRFSKRQKNPTPSIVVEEPQKEPLQPIDPTDDISYSLQNNELAITFNKGNDWATVSVQKDLLFKGGYNGNGQELISGSYILSDERVAFLYSDGVNWDRQRILLTYSIDQGVTWKESVIASNFSVMRFRKVDFTNEQFGYVIISGGRTMSQESSHVFLTRDGGKSWVETNNSGVTRLIYDGGFVDEFTGFLSFGILNPEEPDLYVTHDSGNTWGKSDIHVPGNYKNIFVMAETPVKEGNQLSLLVNQGPNGDYDGGKVKGKFVSKDNGETWQSLEEVAPLE